MRRDRKRGRLVVVGLLGLGLAAVAGVATSRWFLPEQAGTSWGWRLPGSRRALEKLEVYGQVPDFELTERSGRRIILADLRGRVWIANFMYTNCTETCPLQSAHLARLQAEFAGEPDLRLVSITVDPKHDTPAVLAEYAGRYRADPERWLFLTGPKDAISRLAVEGFHLGVVGPSSALPALLGRLLGPASAWAHTEDASGPIMHSSRFVLVDRAAWIRGYFDSSDPVALERLRHSVSALLRERRPEVAALSAPYTRAAARPTR